MRSSLGFVFLGLVCLALAHGGHDHSHDHDDGHSHVVVLNPSNFDEEIAKNDVTLVEFYAPWCGHCKKLAPEFDKASNELAGMAGALAKIDCDDKTNKPACDKYGVRGYPTLKVFYKGGKGEPVEYPGGRTADAIVKFMKKQLQPAFTQVATEEEVKALFESAVAVVAFAEPGAAEAVVFKTVAQQLRNDYTFAIAAPALASKFGVSAPAVVVLKASEEPAVYAGEWEQAALAKWVGDEAFPVFGEIGPDTYQKYLDRNLPLAWFFVDLTAADYKSMGQAIGTEFKGKVSATYLDGVRWADHAKQMGAKSGPPSLVIEDRENDKRYVLQGEEAKSLDAVRAHVQAFLDGKLEPTLKSEEPPADNSGPVKVVVGKTFQEIVMDDSKDVMVEFYAPWCGHCKSLAPKWEELGKLFAKDPSIVIAKVDSTENDTPAPVKGFPTLIFYPAGDKGKPQTYSGERTVDAMAKFIREHATTLSNKEDL